MKYLKHYENNGDDILDYIKSCFIDFIDDEKVRIEYNGEIIELELEEPEMSDHTTTDINEFIDFSKKILNFYEDLDDCIKKFKIRYDNEVIINRFIIAHIRTIFIEIKR